MSFFSRKNGRAAARGRFGSVATRLGHASQAQVDAALEEQRGPAGGPSEHRPLGSIMVQMGMLTPMQLGHILSRSKTDEFRISEDAFRLAARLEMLFEGGQVFIFSGAGRSPALSDLVNQIAIAATLLGHGPTLLVDGDLEQPSLHGIHKLPASPGLGDVLLEKAKLESVVRSTAFDGLALLAAGDTGHCPMPLMLSEHVGELFAEMRRKYKLVLVAAAPILDGSETSVLAAHANGAVIGAVAGQDSLSRIAQAAELFEALRIPVLGSILCE